MKQKKYRYPAPAKLNLFLHVTGVGSDGRHDLQTLFQILDHEDEIDYRLRNDGQLRVHCTKRELQNENNLVTRAARALQEIAGTEQGADIHLHKRIPIAAGLGGGSSDAATTLHALNRLWGCALSTHELADIGATLGADVPVFVHGRSAWGEGVGDRLTPVSVKPAWYAVFVPQVHYTTAEQFAHPDLERDREPVTMHDYLAGRTCNVFEPIARRYEEIADLLDWLNDFAPARLSGTGPGVFASFANEHGARACMAQKSSSVFGCVARGLDRSPLCE